MPRNTKANRPRCPDAYVYIQECEARLAGSKPVRKYDYDEGRQQVWQEIPERIRHEINDARRNVLSRHAPSRECIAFNVKYIKDNYAP